MATGAPEQAPWEPALFLDPYEFSLIAYNCDVAGCLDNLDENVKTKMCEVNCLIYAAHIRWAIWQCDWMNEKWGFCFSISDI